MQRIILLLFSIYGNKWLGLRTLSEHKCIFIERLNHCMNLKNVFLKVLEIIPGLTLTLSH